MMRTFFGALSFLTIVRVPWLGMDCSPGIEPGRAAAFFPLIGAMIGAAGAGIFLAASYVMPVSIAALLTIAFWTAISGVMHEDGLADVTDALRAGRSREKMIAILKDSRIGTYGAVAIVLSLLVRWQALENIPAPHVFAICVMAQAVPRAAMVALAWVSLPAGDGLGLAFSSTLTSWSAIFAIIQGAAVAMLTGWKAALLVLAGSYLIVSGARYYFYQRIGGVNGDCLGATEQLTEIFVLILFASGKIYEL